MNQTFREGALLSDIRKSAATRLRLALFAAVVMATAPTLRADDSAQLLVYARRDTDARSWLPISCGGGVVAEIKAGSYFVVNVPPGRYTLSIENGIPLTVEGRAGERDFVRLDWDYSVGRRPIAVLSKVVEATARNEIKNLGYIGAKRIHSRLVPKIEPAGIFSPELHTRDE